MQENPTPSMGTLAAEIAAPRTARSTADQSRSAGTTAVSCVGRSISYAILHGFDINAEFETSRTAALTDDVPTSTANMCIVFLFIFHPSPRSLALQGEFAVSFRIVGDEPVH
jgi:hypothetical protein